jgi:CHAD domain-containing protein
MRDVHAGESIVLWRTGNAALSEITKLVVDLGFTLRLHCETTAQEAFYDTADWMLYRSGAACSARALGSSAVLTVEPIGNGVVPPDYARGVQLSRWPSRFPGRTRIGAWLTGVFGELMIERRIGLTRTTRAFDIANQRGTCAKLRIAQLEVSASGPEGHLLEVELIPVVGAAREARKIAGALTEHGLVAAESHALLRAAATFSLALPSLVEDEGLRVRSDDRLVEAAYRTMRRQYRRLLWHEPGTRLGLDPEHLHDMRVAARRLRAALRVFRAALPEDKTQALADELRWLRGALGSARDLDVYLLALHQAEELGEEALPALAAYRETIEAQRDQARAAMRRALTTVRYRRLVASFGRFIEAGPPERPDAVEAEALVGAAASAMVLRAFRRVRQSGRAISRKSPATTLHQLRILCKQLRYVCEFFADLYGEAALSFARRVVELQDALGDHHDMTVGREWLVRFAEESARTSGRRSVVRLDRLLHWHDRRIRAAHEEFLRLWRQFDKKSVFRPLKASLAAARAPNA